MKKELNHIWSKGDNEIDLFQKMCNILSKKFETVFIKETHKHRIKYHSSTVKQIADREISDLWIITYSPTQKRIKSTFLQAKYRRTNILPSRNFQADYFQFELLSTRPKLLTGSGFNFPLDILSIGCCDSIGSYGVFYIDNNKSINMAYCCASKLTPLDIPHTYGQFSVNLTFPELPVSVNNCHCGKCLELNYTYDIDCFAKSLLDLNIGAELQYHPHILSFIAGKLSGNGANNVVSELNSLIVNIAEDISSGEFISENNGRNLPNILIINVDEKTNH